jgi:tripartite-type tricarboxylate transporter receptor subunit TctC
MKGKAFVWITVFVLLGILAYSVAAQADYPERPIQLIAGFQAGGNVDTVARILAKSCSSLLGQPVVVDNKPGAGGGVAATTLKSAKPDGYTLCLNMSTAYTFNPLMGASPYGIDDFAYIAAAGKAQEAFVSSSEAEWKDWKGMIAESKKRGMTYASMIPLDKIFTRTIGKKEGVQFSAIPTKGGAEIMTSILGKHSDFGFSGGLHYSYAKAGQMIVLAGLGSERLVDFPEAPTLKELGYDIVFENYVVITAPKGIPDAVIKKLSSAFAKAIQDPEYVNMMKNNIHWVPLYLDSAKASSAIREMSASYKKMIDEQK